ncbi:hypothetical protein [Clostridium butyricum]|uniref:hypothetical protein n=1 Tax=Clostridium butyricum TaxID=1492 RepID=UPI00374F5015
MKKIILHTVNVERFVRSAKQKGAQDKINEFITENNLNVISVSLFKENEDEYLFTLTCE